MVRDELLHVLARAHGPVDDGPHARLDPYPDPGQAQRHHDVGEEDRCVYAVTAYRLQGRLGCELGAQTDLQHLQADLGAHRAVLGQ